MLILSLVLLAVALVIRTAMVNRYVRGRLVVSIGLFAAAAAGAVAIGSGRVPPDVARQIAALLPLVVSLGLITSVVALVINPWRTDRVPDRFPNIVQDALVIALFGLTATLILQEKILTTTAVGAVVIGLALQDTLGNLFAGLAIQIEKPFRVGHWVSIAGRDGIVSEITWRATKIRTKAGNFVIVPNSVLAKDAIVNYSEPTLETRLELEIGCPYDVPPNQVKRVILDAIADEPLLATGRTSEVLVVEFGASAIIYRVRVWTEQFDKDERVRDHIRSRLYYGLRRAGIEIPFPTHVEIQQPAAEPARPSTEILERAIRGVDVFSPLTDDQRRELTAGALWREYGSGEAIVRQGAAGNSLFVVCAGEAVVLLEDPKREVARLKAGQFFGEMSLLTGEPRTATVMAATDCAVLEITVDDFRRLVLADPAVVERVAGAVALRRAELERHRAAGTERPETEQSLVARVRRFLRLATS